jgi:methyl-accepting chemotaxis protein
MSSFFTKIGLTSHKIGGKITFTTVTLALFTMGVLVLYSVFNLRNTEVNAAKQSSLSVAHDFSGRFKSKIEHGLITTRSLANAFSGNGSQPNRDQVNFMLQNILKGNPDLLGIYTCWEPNAFDNQDTSFVGTSLHDGTGRFIPYWTNSGGQIGSQALVDYTVDNKATEWYFLPQKTLKDVIVGPIIYNVAGKDEVMISMLSPVVRNGSFLGIFGVDYSASELAGVLQNQDLFNGKGEITLVNNSGVVVASTNTNLKVGEVAGAELLALFNNNKVNKNGDYSDIVGDVLYASTSVNFGDDEHPWNVVVSVPVSVLTAEANTQMFGMFMLSILCLAAFIVITVLLLRRLTNPIRELTEMANSVAEGDLDIKAVKANSEEIENLNSAFTKVVESRKDITDVCTSIANGDFHKRAIARSDKDDLAMAVNQMIDNLKKASEDDIKRNWISEGLAKFADLLRSQDDLEVIGDSLVSNIAKYVKINQAAIFIAQGIEKGDPHIKLLSCYAFNRKKYIDKRIELKEGLVGQCFVEKEKIVLKKVPEDYVAISSGLGDATPKFVLLTPLMVNDTIEGILEIASFRILEPFEIEFIEKISESIASTFRNAKINQNTRILLEDSKIQTEQLKAQEEEMRQNMEEMQATQEELVRKEREINKLLEETRNKSNQGNI